MKLKTAQMLDEKMRFVRRIETLLAFDQKNNNVDCLQYKVEFQNDNCYDEYVKVVYENGNEKPLLVTGNSNGAILKEIVKEVYR